MKKRRLRREQIFVHVPVWYFRREFKSVLDRRLQPELYFSSDDLKGLDRRTATRLAGLLRGAGLGCTVHAPFFDLNPGALDEDVRLLTLEKYRRLLEKASLFQPKAIVFHPGYDRVRYDGQVAKWLQAAVRTFRRVLEEAGSLVPSSLILVENIFEEEPSSLQRLLRELDHPLAGFCFDAGHSFVFSRDGLDAWMDSLGDKVAEVHLHDNAGRRDDHLPPGQGRVPFERLFARLEDRGKIREVLLTLEAHNEEHLNQSLSFLERRFLIEGA